MLEVALFPIPNMVAFPGVSVPLHVFEPRYRKLVHECVAAERMVGVCHVSKLIREAPSQQTTIEALSSNQATYKPRSVFSAGLCEVHSVLEDGRIMAEVHMQARLTLVEEIQSLPYQIVTCATLEDEPETENSEINLELKSKITATLINLVGTTNPELTTELQQLHWTTMSPTQFSFSLFQLLRLDAQVMQLILESRTTYQRLLITSQALGGGDV